MVAWQQGDAAAFDLLVERYHRRLNGYLRRTCPTQEAADDAYGETLLRLVDRRDQYDPSRPFRPWLYTLAHHAGVGAARKRSRRRGLLERFHLRPVGPPTPHDDLERSRTRSALDAALDRLPPLHRSILILTYKEDLKGPEVAEALGITPREVRDKLAYGRKKLREILTEGEA